MPGLDSRAKSLDLLPRRLGFWSAVAVVVGATIGSGIFRVPSGVAALTDSVASIALLWVLGALVSLFGVLSMAELAAMFPRPGGLYVFLREAYGPLPAFLFGWTRLLVIQPSELGAIAMVFAGYAGTFVSLTDAQVRVVAGSIIALLAAANYRSLTWGATLQNLSSLAKVAALVALALIVFVFGDQAGGAFQAPGALGPATWGGFGLAFISVMWAFDGWAEATYLAGEMQQPERTLPRALVAGMLTIAVVYLLVNGAYLFVLPLDAMATSTQVAADAATLVFGTVGASLIAALVMLSTFGALNSPIMTGPRVFYALATDGLFFRQVGKVHPRFQTPHVAVVLCALLGIGYVSVRTFEQLAEAFILGIWPFYALGIAAVFLLRRSRPELPRPYRTPGYPLVPALVLVAAAGMIGNALVQQPLSTLFGFGLILAGVPAYYVWRRLSPPASRP